MMKGSCNKPYSDNASCKHTPHRVFILAIADRGIVTCAKAFTDEPAAQRALAEYLRNNHRYFGPADMQDIIEWLNEHDEYLSAEIIQQDVSEVGSLINHAQSEINCPSCGGKVECHPDQDGSCDWQCSRCAWHQHVPGNVDLELLTQQAAILGKAMDNIPLADDERTCLQGLWEFVHRVADCLESNS